MSAKQGSSSKKRKMEDSEEGSKGGSSKSVHKMEKYVLYRQSFDALKLESDYPPKFKCINKVLVYSMISPLRDDDTKVIIAKYSSIPFPSSVDNTVTKHIVREDGYTYVKEKFEGYIVEWYVNFADYALFGFYGGNLFAQDEMQVMEHPALGSVREALLKIAKNDISAAPITRDKKTGDPTPFLIQGVKRRVALSIDPNPKAGRPDGLYGHNFAEASDEAICKATRIVDPPTLSNIVAMEAPYGKGKYTLGQIQDIFSTAFTSFAATMLESTKTYGNCTVVIHTGNWGTGAYGGNKVLMAILQMLAADVAGVDVLIYHAFDKSSVDAYKTAQGVLESILTDVKEGETLQEALHYLYKQDFKWGVGDGN